MGVKMWLGFKVHFNTSTFQKSSFAPQWLLRVKTKQNLGKHIKTIMCKLCNQNIVYNLRLYFIWQLPYQMRRIVDITLLKRNRISWQAKSGNSHRKFLFRVHIWSDFILAMCIKTDQLIQNIYVNSFSSLHMMTTVSKEAMNMKIKKISDNKAFRINWTNFLTKRIIALKSLTIKSSTTINYEVSVWLLNCRVCFVERL